MVPFITIVMPVRNEAGFIGETVSQLLSQDYPNERFEIIVADGMSDDRTRDIVTEISREYSQVRLMDNPGRRSSAGRNVGFKNGRGDIFLVIDGHCFIPDNQLLQNVVACFEKSGADCLGRPQPLDPPGLSAFQQSVALARGTWLGHGGDSLIYGQFEGYASPASNGAVYKRCVFDLVGYVDEHFDACEDLEHNYRVEKAGLKAYTSPKLTVRYYPRESLPALFRQMVRYGRGRFRFVRKHPDALTVNQLVPAGFVAGLFLLITACFSEALGLLILASMRDRAIALPGVGEIGFLQMGVVVTFSHWIVLILTLLYALYALILLFESLRIAVSKGGRYLPILPLIFFTIHFGLGFGLLVEAAKHLLPLAALSQKIRNFGV
jgi:succinoglycan biosynthesis protein ExoA